MKKWQRECYWNRNFHLVLCCFITKMQTLKDSFMYRILLNGSTVQQKQKNNLFKWSKKYFVLKEKEEKEI